MDSKVYKFLYACGIPFNVLRSPYWHEMVSSINDALKGYKSPEYDKARTVGLDHEKAKISHYLSRMTNSWTKHGAPIVSDGWTNVARSGSEAEARSRSAERGSVIFQKSRRRSVRGSVCYIYIYFYIFLHLYSKQTSQIPN